MGAQRDSSGGGGGRPPPAGSEATPVLSVAGIRKGFAAGFLRRRIEVLRDAELHVMPGELVGLVGENGSGKSVLMKIIVGLMSREAGEVTVAGKLGYCPQQPMVWEKLTVAEHFELFAQAYGLRSADAGAAEDALLAELGFERYAGYRVEELSGGTKQKLNLALALMHEPDLLLLDEPYSGFDWETYLRFWDMAEERRRNGMGILTVWAERWRAMRRPRWPRVGRPPSSPGRSATSRSSPREMRIGAWHSRAWGRGGSWPRGSAHP